MEQKKHQKRSQEQLPFSEQLRQSIINQPCDLAVLWVRAADSFPQISANNVFAPLLQSWSVSLSAHWRYAFYPRPSVGFDYKFISEGLERLKSLWAEWRLYGVKKLL